MLVYSGMRDGSPSFYESYSRTAYSPIYPTERKPQGRDHCPQLSISDDMPESGGGGGGESAAPEVAASDDDDGGDSDGEPARSRPHSNPSKKPAHGSASPKHSAQSRTRHQAEPPSEIKTIAIGEFDLAAAIGMSVDFLRKDRSGKRIIPFFRIGKAIRYNPQRVNEALASLEEGGHKPPKPKASTARQSNLTAG